MAMRTVDAQRAYDEGYKQALLDALRERRPAFDPHKKIGGPDSRYKPRGTRGSLYNTPEDEERIRNPFRLDHK